MAAKNAGNNQAVHQLVNWYANETASLAQDPLAQEPWAYGTYTDGTAISKPQRLVYRERTDLQAAFPDPFDATTYLPGGTPKAKSNSLIFSAMKRAIWRWQNSHPC